MLDWLANHANVGKPSPLYFNVPLLKLPHCSLLSRAPDLIPEASLSISQLANCHSPSHEINKTGSQTQS